MTMTLIVVLVCLAIQRFVKIDFKKPTFAWFFGLFNQLDNKLRVTSWWQGYWGIALLYTLVCFIYLAVILILTHIFGIVFSFLFNLVVLWYYLDARLLALSSEKVLLPELFVNRYYAIFGVIFWYVVAGPLGVILYEETRRLCNHLKRQQETDVYFSNEYLHKITQLRSLTDWLPVRLVGLTYALVGQFRPAFQYWYQRLKGLEVEPLLVANYGMIALNWDPSVTASGSLEEVSEIESLTNRALCVWLFLLGIFTLGSWLS